MQGANCKRWPASWDKVSSLATTESSYFDTTGEPSSREGASQQGGSHAIPAQIEVLDRWGEAICEEDHFQMYSVSQVRRAWLWAKVPPENDLPGFRLSQKPAFTYVGVDYTGSLYIKERNCSALKNVYVLLFTWLSTRAVHLELATDLSADVFIRCLRRFTARRGLPEIIVSVNAKTFKAATKVLRKVFPYPSVKRFLANRRITWRFNIDRAPWWGDSLKGWYRMRNNVCGRPWGTQSLIMTSCIPFLWKLRER